MGSKKAAEFPEAGSAALPLLEPPFALTPITKNKTVTSALKESTVHISQPTGRNRWC